MHKVTSAEGRIADFLKAAAGTRIAICKYVYDILIKEEENAPELLRFFMEQIDSIESSKTQPVNEYADSAHIPELVEKYGKGTDDILEKLLPENSGEQVFYEKLWDSIQHTPVLKEEGAQVFALYYISIDTRIPYFHLELKDPLPDDLFKESVKRLFPEYMKSCFILNTPVCKKKTQSASLILSLINSLADENDKAVLLALISEYILRRGEEIGKAKDKEKNTPV
jgi:hypothetical protein